jgi:hypothetical protein
MRPLYVIRVTGLHRVGVRACIRCVKGEGTMTNATVGETPIFDELRELFGKWEIEELIGRAEED